MFFCPRTYTVRDRKTSTVFCRFLFYVVVNYFSSRRRRGQPARPRGVPEGRRSRPGHADATLQRAAGADHREGGLLPGRGAEREDPVAGIAHAVHAARLPVHRTDRIFGR